MRTIRSSVLFILIMIIFTVLPASGQDIFKAVDRGDLDQVKELLKRDKKLLESTNNNGSSLLHVAAFRGHREIVEYLLSEGINPDCEDSRKMTPLILAVYFGHKNVAAVLLDHGADINKKDSRGSVPLRFAIDQRDVDMVKFLIDRGASLDVKDNIGNTMLMLTILKNDMKMTRLLIEKGMDINARNNRGGSPLSIAQREGYDEITKFLLSNGAKSGKDEVLVLKGDYLGQTMPGNTPRIFALNFVSTERSQLNACFMPNLSEFYFCVRGDGQMSNIMETRRIDNTWTKPQPVSFSSEFSEIDLFISPDGKKMFFCSNRSVNQRDERKQDHDFWVSERKGNLWGEPVHLGNLVNSEREDFYPTVTRDYVLYFSSQREGPGTNNVYRSTLQNGIYGEAKKLGPEINTHYREFDPFIALDESYLIFASERPGGLGGSDLYISFRKNDGSWTEAVNMGKEINSPEADYTPVVTPDGKFLFFTSSRGGVDDIYWVDAGIIIRLKQK
jgi:ankyrin repeat protein